MFLCFFSGITLLPLRSTSDWIEIALGTPDFIDIYLLKDVIMVTYSSFSYLILCY